MPDLEPFAFYFLAAGAAVLVIGLLWMLVVAFRTGFILKMMIPLLVILLGVAVALFVPVTTKLFPKPTQKTAQVFGDSITVTGAKRDQIPIVFGHTEWKTIQAASRPTDPLNLTDEDVKGVEGMNELEFIDLANNPITDVTLERLVKLPKLTKLYASMTNITGDTVKRLVLDNPDCKLTEIDFRNLTPPVKGADLRAWKEKDKDNRKFNN